MQGHELYLILSDLCNFSCSHCINSSGPRANRWRLEPSEVAALAAEIESCSDIRAIHFTGGEPTLQLPQVLELQSRLGGRNLSYAMTTNGWFVDRSVGLIDDLGLDELVVSYDKFHRPFIEGKRLLPLIRHAQERGTAVSVNFVFEGLEDLVEAEPFQGLGATVHLSRLITGGRASEEPRNQGLNDERALDRGCPSLDADQRRRGDLEKVVHIPGRGFTPCCGPLAFDDQAEGDFVFSRELASYESNPLRAELRKGSFRTQFEALGLKPEGEFQSACDACRLLHGKGPGDSPSLAMLASQCEETAAYVSTGRLDADREAMLGQRFIVSYVHTLSPQSLASALAARSAPKPSRIEAMPLEPEEIPEVIDFVERTYFLRFPEHYGEYARARFRNEALAYLSRSETRVLVYRREQGGGMLACLFAHEYESHPFLKEASLHIGYWGYDRDLLGDPEEAQCIRADWLQALLQWSRGELPIDATIDCFNSPALRLIEKLGFTHRMIRLDRKVEA